jgi:N-acetyl-alpha-D-muramate 1-phosphate uridylyltransferase
MDAMILAAGLGTRLGDITQHMPKALVDVAGVSALERVARSLIEAGADRIVINVHHHAQQIIDHVRGRDDFGVEVVFSVEETEPLETGGGLLHAAPLLRRDAPFFLHNVDVLSRADLRALYAAHRTADALATLAVSRRVTTRYLLFDEEGLCGRVDRRGGVHAEVHARRDGAEPFAFAGMHVVAPRLLDMLEERGPFSIIDAYLRLASEGERIRHFDVTGTEWLEIGTPDRLEAARRAFSDIGNSD